MITYYIPAPGQANTAARMTALGAVPWDAWVPKPALAATPVAVLYSPALDRYATYHDDGTLTAATVQADPLAAADAAAINAATIQARAQAALAANATYQALGSPSNAQVAAQVLLLTRECNALIKLALGLLSDTTGT